MLYFLKLLIAMILGGLSADTNTHSSASFIQLQKKSTKNASDSKNNRHTPSREPPLSLYLSLKLHSVTWSKKLVQIVYGQISKNCLQSVLWMAWTIIRHSSQWNHHLMILASVSFNFLHLTPMTIAKLESFKYFMLFTSLIYILRFLLYHS